MNKGIKDLFFSFGAKTITIISALGVQVCLAWFLGTSGRGSYAVCILFSGLLGIIFFMGCELAGVYFVSSRRFSLSEGVIYTLIYGVVGSVLAVAAGLILMQFPLTIFEKADRPELYLALASIPGFLFFTVFSQLFTAIRQFGWFSAVTLLRGLCLLVFTPLFLWVLDAGTPGAIMAIIASDLVVVVVCLLVFRRKFGLLNVHPRLKNLLAMLHYGARYCVGVISNQFNFRIGTLILAFFATKEEIGIYALAVGLTIQIQILPDAVKTALIPRSASDEAGRKELVAQCARLTALISFLMLLGFILLAKLFLTIIFPESFASAAPLIRILAFGFFIRTLGKSLEPYLIGSNRPGLISISVAGGMAVNIACLFLLLPRLGLPGAAWSVVCNYLVSSAILIFSFSRLSEMDWRSIWRLRASDFAFLDGLKTRFFPGKT
ncbi:MAG: oligosaccharide flippase family protein [PVC group bacterium]